jgi:hypothetical protein
MAHGLGHLSGRWADRSTRQGGGPVQAGQGAGLAEQLHGLEQGRADQPAGDGQADRLEGGPGLEVAFGLEAPQGLLLGWAMCGMTLSLADIWHELIAVAGCIGFQHAIRTHIMQRNLIAT